MVQVTAINTRKVHKVDGKTIFNIVKQMTGESDAEINRIIGPELVPMIGRNDADSGRRWYNSSHNPRVSWDTDQQVSWGNALKHLRDWTENTGNYNYVSKLIADGAPAPPAWTDWHTKNKPVPWTPTQKENTQSEIMVMALVDAVSWNARATEKPRLQALPFKKLETEFMTKRLGSYSWRAAHTAAQKQQELDKQIKRRESDEQAGWYRTRWDISKARWDPEVLMLAGQNQPQYYMSWIIANTYHSTNPIVKNIASHQGSFKYRNWELKERYYPTVGPGDTLPKTTAKWPRYGANPKELSIFTLPEMAAALKSTFGAKQTMMATHKAKAKSDHQKTEIRNKDRLLDKSNVQRTITEVVRDGLDRFNERQFRANYSYYADGTSYNTQKNEEIPVNERIKIEWSDIQHSMGLPAFKKAVKEYQTNAKTKHDRIVRDAKAELDKAEAQVAAANKYTKTKKSKK